MILKLSNGEAIIDDEDYSLIKNHIWCVDGRGYVVTNLGNGKTLSLHRFLLNPPDNMEVDHRNRNGLDNRRKNIRVATKQQNRFNQEKYKNNTVGYKGVYFDKARNKFATSIMVGYVKRFLGRFNTALEASQAYEKAAKELHGEFYYQNG